MRLLTSLQISYVFQDTQNDCCFHNRCRFWRKQCSFHAANFHILSGRNFFYYAVVYLTSSTAVTVIVFISIDRVRIVNHFLEIILRTFGCLFLPLDDWRTSENLYCCTVHLVDSLIITQPTNALILIRKVRILKRDFSQELYVLPDDNKRYAIETCRSSESVLKKVI